MYNIYSCSGSLAGTGFVRVRSFCPGVRSGWHLSELDRCFFAIGVNFIVVKYGGDGLIGGVLQNYHARSKRIML